MKNKSFSAIVITSLIIFLGLLFSVYKIYTKNGKSFYANGYVSATDNASSKKVYFDAGTNYKKGYNSEIIFKNNKNIKTQVSKYSFVYFDDGSIEYLNNGVLMDLDNIKSNFIPYYNIKSNYIISKENGSFVINATDKDITFKNFIGRISESKYVVAGPNLKLKLSSSENFINDKYFELNFSDKEVVKIDGTDLSTQTISKEAYILVDEHTKIDLSKQAVFYDENLIVNLSEIIIDNDNNIDISYDPTKEKEAEKENKEKENENENQNVEPKIVIPERKKEYRTETVTDYKSIPYADLISSNVNSHKIDINFKVIDPNKLINNNIVATCTNLANGNVIKKEYNNGSEIIEFTCDGLQSESKYLATISTTYAKNGNIYDDVLFQRTFTTSSLGVSLERDYISENIISYNVNMNESASFDEAELNLYDTDGNLISSKKITNNHGIVNVLFDNLSHNKQYTAKVENIVAGNVKYTSGYAAASADNTLKYNPLHNGVSANPIAIVHKADYYFELSLENIDDVDDTITKVTYNIYDKETNQLVKKIEKNKVTVEKVEVKDELFAGKIYYFNAIITLNDGEKIIDEKTIDSNEFSIDRLLKPTAIYESEFVNSNSAKGRFIIYDEENAIDYSQGFYAEYVNTLGESNILNNLKLEECENDKSEHVKCVNIDLNNLKSENEYLITLNAYVDLKDEDIDAGFTRIGSIKINTDKANIVKVNYEIHELDTEDALQKLFDVDLNFYVDELETPIYIRDEMRHFDLKLYQGADITGNSLKTVTVTNHILDEYFNNKKNLTLDFFGLTVDQLISLNLENNTKIPNLFTIVINNGLSGTSDNVEFVPNKIPISINEAIMDLVNDSAEIEVNIIPNTDTEENSGYYDENLKNTTAIGLKVIPVFANKQYANEVNFKFKDVTGKECFGEEEEPCVLNITEHYSYADENVPTYYYYMKDYPFFKRGHSYIVEYTVSLDLNDDGIGDYIYPFAKNDIHVANPVVSSQIDFEKELPEIKVFPWTSDANTITYKYISVDPDNTLEKQTAEGNEYIPLHYSTDITEDKIASYYNKCKSTTEGYTCGMIDFSDEINNTSDNSDISHLLYFNARVLDKGEGTYKKSNPVKYAFERPIDITKLSYTVLSGEEAHNNLLILKINSEDSKVLNSVASYKLNLEYDGAKISIDNINDSSMSSNSTQNKITYEKGSTTIKADIEKIAYVVLEENDYYVYFDYSKLYNSDKFYDYFKNFKGKDINISLEANYDSGFIKYKGLDSDNYSFQIWDLDNEKNRYYLISDIQKISTDKSISIYSYSPRALGSIYKYDHNNDKCGFVDDDASDKNCYQKMYFYNSINGAFTNSQRYVLTDKGINVKISSLPEVPLVAKKIETAIIGSDIFKFNNVVPALTDIAKDTYINGASLKAEITGIKDDDRYYEDGISYVYFEVFDENNQVVKTIRINSDNLMNYSGTINIRKFVIENNDDYSVKIINGNDFSINGQKFADIAKNKNYKYYYDYNNSTITFNTDDFAGKTIELITSIVIGGLNPDTNYHLKAYMYLGNNKTKTYLTDTKSSNYSDYIYEFKTKSVSDIHVNNISFDILSSEDYKTRTLKTNYTIDNIIGISDISYMIKNKNNGSCEAGNKNLCIDITNEIIDDCFTKLGNTCVKEFNNNIYSSYTLNDISISDDLDIIYDDNYQVTIYITYPTLNGNVTEELTNQSIKLRALEEPKISITRSSEKNDLTFSIKIDDKDRVIKDGTYSYYLGNGINKQPVSSIKTTKNLYHSANFSSLESNSPYYLIIKYDEYLNNLSAESKEKNVEIPFLAYTTNDYGIGTGSTSLSIENFVPKLKFSYATNIVSPSNPEDSQHGWIAGIIYNVDHNGKSADTKPIIFDENNKIEQGKDADNNTYYMISLNRDNTFTNDGTYIVSYQFYFDGDDFKSLNTKELCLASAGNKWGYYDNNGSWQDSINETGTGYKCLVLDNTNRDVSLVFEGGK